MVLGVNQGVDNTHNHNSVLKTSYKGQSDEVVKQMISWRTDCSILPGSDDEIVKNRAFVLV